MKIFQLKAWQDGWDWASRYTEVDIGFFMTRAGAEKKIKEIKKNKEWRMHWKSFQIWEIEVQA